LELEEQNHHQHLHQVDLELLLHLVQYQHQVVEQVVLVELQQGELEDLVLEFVVVLVY